MIIRLTKDISDIRYGYFTLDENGHLIVNGFSAFPKDAEVLVRAFGGQIFLSLNSPDLNPDSRRATIHLDESISQHKNLIEVFREFGTFNGLFVYMMGMYVQIPDVYISEEQE